MTRFEKIKAMSIEKFAEEFCNCGKCVYNDERTCICKNNCINGCREWLESEAEDEE